MRTYFFGLVSFVLLACAGEAEPAQAPATTVATVDTPPPPAPTATPTAAPTTTEAPVSEPAPTDVDAPNLTMTSMTVDGVELSDIACHTQGEGLGGFFGGLAVGAGFKARKAQLDACSKSPVETRVKWIGAGGRMTQIHASGGRASVNRCVERALRGAVATTSGPCAATVKHGG